MGNKQCVSQRNNNNILWSKIESDLHDKNTTREKKILNEFKNLKRMMTEKKDRSQRDIKSSNKISKSKEKISNTPTRSLKDLHKFVESNPSMILINSDCNLKIRMKRFIKWYKIAFKSKSNETPSKSKKFHKKEFQVRSPFINIYSDVNSPFFKNCHNNNHIDDLNSFNLNLSNFELNEKKFASPFSKRDEDKRNSNMDLNFNLNQCKDRELENINDHDPQLNFKTILNHKMREVNNNIKKFEMPKNFEKDPDSHKNSQKDSCNAISNKSSFINSQKDSLKDSNLFLFNNISDDLIEYNLNQFYINHRSKFLEKISKGPPDSFRWLSWQVFSRTNLPTEVGQNILDQYFMKPLDEETEIQIKKDLPRTLGEDFYFDHPETENLLYKILRAFANLDNEVKYCQGMNFIVRFLLLISDFNENETFLMMIYFFSKDNFSDLNIKNRHNSSNTIYSKNSHIAHNIFTGIRGFFLDNFLLLKFYIFVFNHYFERKMVNLYNHLNRLELPIEVWILKWFQTLYAIYLPMFCVVRLWDCLISIGLDFIIDFTLAILKSKESKILKINEAFDLVDFFKNEFSNQDMDIEEIIKMAKSIIKSKKNIISLKQEYEDKYKIKLDQYTIKYDLNLNFNLEKISSNFFNSSNGISEDNVNNDNNSDRTRLKKINSGIPNSSGTNQSMNSFIKENYFEIDNKNPGKASDIGTLSNLITTKSNTGTAINKSNTLITANVIQPRSTWTFTEVEKMFSFTHKSHDEVNDNNINEFNFFNCDKAIENEYEIGYCDSLGNEFSGEFEIGNNPMKNITNKISDHTISINKDVGIARYSYSRNSEADK